jgi:hypothetical protein
MTNIAVIWMSRAGQSVNQIVQPSFISFVQHIRTRLCHCSAPGYEPGRRRVVLDQRLGAGAVISVKIRVKWKAV